MNALKRGLLYNGRNFKKILILGIVITILATLTVGAILFRHAAILTETQVRRRIPPILSIEIDPEWAEQHWLDTGTSWEETDISWPQELVPEFLELPYVQSFQYTNRFFRPFALELYSPMINHYYDDLGRTADFEVIGTSQPIPLRFEQRVADLIDGRMFTESEILGGDIRVPVPALVSRSLAELNQLVVGTVLTMYHSVHIFPDSWTEEEQEAFSPLTFEIEIIGVYDMEYELMETRSQIDGYWELRQALNTFFVPTWFVAEAEREAHDVIRSVLEEDDFQLEHLLWNDPDSAFPVIILNDSLNIEAFRYVAEPLLPEQFRFTDLSASFSAEITAMSNFVNLANMVLAGAVVATIVVIGLLISLFLQDRRQEIGIYLALGEKKHRILSQIVLEIFTVAIIGISGGLLIGGFLAEPLGRQMLRTQLSVEVSEEEYWQRQVEQGELSLMTGVSPQPLSLDAMEEMFDLSLGIHVVIIFYLIGLSGVIVSVILPIVRIIKLNPKEILL